MVSFYFYLLVYSLSVDGHLFETLGVNQSGLKCMTRKVREPVYNSAFPLERQQIQQKRILG